MADFEPTPAFARWLKARRERRKRMLKRELVGCLSKLRWRSREEGERAALAVWRMKREVMDIYKCKWCSGWHLTSRKGREGTR